MMRDASSADRTNQAHSRDRITTPTRSRRAHNAPTPSSSQELSPLMLARRKRRSPPPQDPASPTSQRRKRGKASEFPNFTNSFAAPPMSTPLPLMQSPRRERPRRDVQDGVADVPPALSRESTPDTLPSEPEMEVDAPALRASEAVALALSVLFRYRVRWITHVMCHNYWPSVPPQQVPGTAYLPLGAGVYAWAEADGVKPPAAGGGLGATPLGPQQPSSGSLLMHLMQMRLPPKTPDVLQQRFQLVLGKLWEFVLQGNSYATFLAMCGRDVDERLRDALTRHGDMDVVTPAMRATIDETIAALWHQQSDYLYGSVAAALRSLCGIFLRLNMVR